MYRNLYKIGRKNDLAPWKVYAEFSMIKFSSFFSILGATKEKILKQ